MYIVEFQKNEQEHLVGVIPTGLICQRILQFLCAILVNQVASFVLCYLNSCSFTCCCVIQIVIENTSKSIDWTLIAALLATCLSCLYIQLITIEVIPRPLNLLIVYVH